MFRQTGKIELSLAVAFGESNKCVGWRWWHLGMEMMAPGVDHCAGGKIPCEGRRRGAVRRRKDSFTEVETQQKSVQESRLLARHAHESSSLESRVRAWISRANTPSLSLGELGWANERDAFAGVVLIHRCRRASAASADGGGALNSKASRRRVCSSAEGGRGTAMLRRERDGHTGKERDVRSCTPGRTRPSDGESEKRKVDCSEKEGVRISTATEPDGQTDRRT
eukprot:6199176-Pleurochrysis_carterae.AAC.3